MENAEPPLVAKEELKNYRFLTHEVLESETEIERRNFLLDEAVLLGNGEKQKVKMIFETTEGAIMVETTIWEKSDLHVELKGAVDVPVCCIREVII